MGGIFVFINGAHIVNMLNDMMIRLSSSKAGLTLIEVLIALAILSIGVSSMMLAMSRCLSVVRTARNRNVAHSLLWLMDVEYPIDKQSIEEISESGDFEAAEGYTWYREVVMVDEEYRPGLFLVITRIEWARRGRNAFEEVVEYKYAPNAESITREP
jgi:prepilin-type N-terminal cleavage/methylation domain-containing protein